MSFYNPNEVLEEIYSNLTTGCLCSKYQQSQHSRAVMEVRPNESSQHVLLLQLSVFRLLSEVLKSSDEDVCANVKRLAQDIIEGDIGRQLLLILLETNDKYVCYAARKAFSAFASHIATDGVEVLVQISNLCQKIVDTAEVSKVNVAMDTLADIIENGLSENTGMQQFSNTDCTKVGFERNKGKVACKAVIQVLGNGLWTEIVAKLNNTDYSSEQCLLTLCYKIILAVKRHFNEDFLGSFIISNVIQIFRNEKYLAPPTLLTTQADMLIEVFTEENVNNSSCWRKQLADAWLVKTKGLSCNSGVWKMGLETIDVILLRKIILSVLKASAILGRERGAILCLKDLSNDQLIELFVDQDDQLIKVMLSILNLHVHGDDSKPVHGLNPHLLFIKFLSTISFDRQVIIDFLISAETQFLLFFTKYLKLVIVEWQEFVNACSSSENNLETIMTTVIGTRFAVERLEGKELFPYNAGPLIKLIKKCEHLYEGDSDSE